MRTQTLCLLVATFAGVLATPSSQWDACAKETKAEERRAEKEAESRKETAKRKSAKKSSKQKQKKKRPTSKKPRPSGKTSSDMREETMGTSSANTSTGKCVVPTMPGKFVSPSRDISGQLLLVPDEAGNPILWLVDTNSTRFRLVMSPAVAERLDKCVGNHVKIRGEVASDKGLMCIRNIRAFKSLTDPAVPGREATGDPNEPVVHGVEPAPSPASVNNQKSLGAGDSGTAKEMPGSDTNPTQDTEP